MNKQSIKENFERTLHFFSNKIVSTCILIPSAGIAALIGLPSSLPRIIHALLFGLIAGLICLILFVLTFVIVFMFFVIKSSFNRENPLLSLKQTACVIVGIILLYFIATLPIGLHSVSRNENYIYVNYLGIPKITKVYDFIGAKNDTVGDYSFLSDIHQAYPFDNGKASVWLFYSNFSEYETFYMPACINSSGNLLFYGYCDPKQEVDDSYAKEIFESHNFSYDKNIPLWKQYDDFYEFLSSF